MLEIIINENDQNKRLDKFVKKVLLKAPDSFIYKLFRKKDIKVNKKHKSYDYITSLNDIVDIYIEEIANAFAKFDCSEIFLPNIKEQFLDKDTQKNREYEE